MAYLDLDLFALLLDTLDLCLEPSDLFLDKLQTAVDRHERLGLVLLQQHRADLLVDACFVVKEVEFLRFRLSTKCCPVACLSLAHLLDCRVFLLLRLELLTRLYGRPELCFSVSRFSQWRVA